MHQTVREFFLRPHNSVINSHFQNNINTQPAHEMIAITCIRYLDLHYRELGNEFQSTAGASVSSWSSKDIFALVQYLNKRPLIKYSLEFLTALKEKINVNPDIPKPLLDLTANLELRLQRCPSALRICLPEGLTNSNFDTQRVQELNHLLGIAAESGYTVAIGNLLAAGAECNTALHSATRGGHVTTVRLLLDRGADTEANDSNKRTPLHMAAWDGHEAAIELLLDKGADIEAKDSDSWTPLHMAARQGHRAAIGLLLDRGAAVKAKNSDIQTALHMASGAGHEAAIDLLLDQGADIEAKDLRGLTPLHIAARDGREAAIKLLLGRGAGIGAGDIDKQTPLHMAAWYGHEAAVGLLLDRGADIEAKDLLKQTPLHRAALGGYVAVIELLLDREASTLASDAKGETPLDKALSRQREAVAGSQLNQGERTASHIAALCERDSATKLLLNRGADIEAIDPGGQASLDNALLCGCQATAGLLRNRDIDMEANDFGEQPPPHRRQKRSLSSEETQSRSGAWESTETGSRTTGQRKRRRTSS